MMLRRWSEDDLEELARERIEAGSRADEIAFLLCRSTKEVERKIVELDLDRKPDLKKVRQVEEDKRCEDVQRQVQRRQSFRFPLAYRAHIAGKRWHAQVKDARFAVAVAGRRGGKTQAGAAEVARRIVRDAERKVLEQGPWEPAPGKDPKPFLRYAVVAPTYALLNEPKMALQRYLGLVEHGGLIVTQGQTEWWLVGGIRIDFRSGDRPERLVSHGYDGIWLDEAARCKAAVWSENIRATLSDTMGWALFTSTPLGRNWLWRDVWCKCDAKAAAELAKLEDKRVEEILDSAYAGATWTTADNGALKHLAAEMEQARRELPEEEFARNYLAGFDVFPGQIFRLTAERHLASDRPTAKRYKRYVAGIDVGWDHPTVISLWGILPNNEAEEIETIAASNVLYDDTADWQQRDGGGVLWTSRAYQLFKRWGLDWRRVVLKFPADAPEVREAFERRGFNVETAYQAHEPALTWFRTAFHCNRARVRTAGLWTCLLALRRPEPGKRSTKAWVDVDDDHWDASRYALSDLVEPGGVSPTGTSLPSVGWTAPR